MTGIQYIEIKALQARSANSQAPDVEVDGTLLVSVHPVLSFHTMQGRYGSDYVEIYASIHNGKRSFLRRNTWHPSDGYSSEGIEEYIISFEEGVKIFLENGMFNFPANAYDKNEDK